MEILFSMMTIYILEYYWNWYQRKNAWIKVTFNPHVLADKIIKNLDLF